MDNYSLCIITCFQKLLDNANESAYIDIVVDVNYAEWYTSPLIYQNI